MPKSQKIENKLINGIKVDKENTNVFFNDETHKYYDKTTLNTYVSVTTLINNYCNQFDEEFWSSYKALEEIMPYDAWSNLREKLLSNKIFKESYLKEYNIDSDLFYTKKQEIKDSYKKSRDDACAKGTAKHLEKELSFYNKDNFDFSKYGLSDLSGQFFCEQDHFVLDAERGVYPEYLISVDLGDNLRIAGQIDLLVKDGDDFFILDYKTNSEIKKRSYFDKKKKKNVMMKFPLNNLEDSVWNHYQLQLSLYAYLLEQIKPEANVKTLRIIHLLDDGSEKIMECEYLKNDVERMLNHYKKQQKIKSELDRIKPVKIG